METDTIPKELSPNAPRDTQTLLEEQIPAFIRSKRKEAGMTLEQLAANCEIKREALNGIENGKRKASSNMLQRILTQLGYSIDVNYTLNRIK